MLTVAQTVCPFCGGRKERGHCFCAKCWVKVPDDARKAIARGMLWLSRGLRKGIAELEG